MAPTDTPSWSFVRGLGANSAELFFTVDSAKIGINACTDLMWALLSVQDTLNRDDKGSICNPRDFAGPKQFPSGAKWADVFRSAGVDLRDRVNSQIAVVKAMGETMQSAIKAFGDAEEKSADDLRKAIIPGSIPSYSDDLSTPNGKAWDSWKNWMSTNAPTPWPQLGNSPANAQISDAYKKLNEKDSDRTSELPGLTNLMMESGDNQKAAKDHKDAEFLTTHGAVQPEWPFYSGFHWDDFYEFGNSIVEEQVMTTAVGWELIRGELDRAYKEFESKSRRIADGWQGHSSESATTAMAAVIADGAALVAKIPDIEDRLMDAHGWLKAARLKMPTNRQPKLEDVKKNADETYVVQIDDRTGRLGSNNGGNEVGGPTPEAAIEHGTTFYRIEFYETYFKGIEAHNKALASLTFPTMTSKPGTSALPPPPEVLTPPDDKSKGNGGNPSAGSPSAGSPSAPGGTPTVPDGKDPKDTDPKETDPKDVDKNTKDTTKTGDTTLSTIVSAVENLAQQGVSLVESLASTGETALQQGITSLSSLLTSQQTTQTTTTDQVKQLEEQLAALTNTPTDKGSPVSPGGGTPGGPSTTTPVKDTPQTTRLFPRANVPATTDEKEETVTASRAGLATGSTTSTATSGASGSGMPMGGAGAAGGQGSGKEHKRPEYLRSGENLEEVFEGLPEAVRPVAEK
ncbi:hypothetical protein ACFXHA_06815 [Nocardia sp. NPDC059240]|uniref:hypothetical protein n=1 Tax=Nocardia sp. NPDC059240 TaxID=3346786 RepID=UPI0036CC5E08